MLGLCYKVGSEAVDQSTGLHPRGCDHFTSRAHGMFKLPSPTENHSLSAELAALANITP